MNFPQAHKVSIEEIPLPFKTSLKLYIKREDQIHPKLSGNKYWKLKYNFEEALHQNKDTLLSFGGAYSNHLSALAELGNLKGISTVGIVRGEELESLPYNLSLQKNNALGMQLHFVSREAYRRKETDPSIQSIIQQYPNAFVIPEGGSNALAVKGTQEILTPETHWFTHIITAVGTGGTLAGLAEAALPHQKIMGIPVLKNAQFLYNDLKKLTQKQNFELDLRFHFGGYGKYNPELIAWVEKFNKQYSIPLDIVYTAKMMYGVIQRIEQNEFPENARILTLHTGGLQGNPDFLKNVKNLYQ